MMASRKAAIWTIQIKTDATDVNGVKTGIPLDLSDSRFEGVTVKVDWGDGQTSILMRADYSDGSVAKSVHTYAKAGTYTVKIKSKQWEKIYLVTPDADVSTGDNTQHVAYFRRTLVGLLSPLPKYAGRFSPSNQKFYTHTCATFFRNCSKLESIPADLFEKNPQLTDFDYCFYGCSKLTTIPADLFKNNTEAKDFNYCFSNCTALTTIPGGLFSANTKAWDFHNCFNKTSETTIPADLFKNNTEATDFHNCFSSCYALTTIPEGLFSANTKVTSFLDCFANIATLTSVPTDLFKTNTAVTNFRGVFYNAVKLTSLNVRIGSKVVTNASTFYSKGKPASVTVYVPKGSTTKTTFAAAGLSGLKLIEE